MLLVIDVGNTNTVFGLYEGVTLRHQFRVESARGRTADEYAVTLRTLLDLRGVSDQAVTASALACVVPALSDTFVSVVKRAFGHEPLVVGPGIKTGMPIYYDNPKEVGADRIVNAVAAFEKYRRDLIIVDFGTATTFDYVSKKGEYMGGCISPGLMISSEALFERAAKLPRVELSKPRSVVAKDTVSSMQAGIVYGYAGLVDGIVNRMKAEVKSDPYVVATGGLAKVVSTEAKSIDEVDDMLTLQGLRIIYDRNR